MTYYQHLEKKVVYILLDNKNHKIYTAIHNSNQVLFWGSIYCLSRLFSVCIINYLRKHTSVKLSGQIRQHLKQLKLDYVRLLELSKF